MTHSFPTRRSSDRGAGQGREGHRRQEAPPAQLSPPQRPSPAAHDPEDRRHRRREEEGRAEEGRRAQGGNRRAQGRCAQEGAGEEGPGQGCGAQSRGRQGLSAKEFRQWHIKKQAVRRATVAIRQDRTRVVEGKSVSVRVDLGGRRSLKIQKRTLRDERREKNKS